MRFWKWKGTGSFSFTKLFGKFRAVAPFAAGIMLTWMAVLLARQRIHTLEREIRIRNAPVEIVVASEDIPEKGTLSINNLAKKAIPAPGVGQRNIPAAGYDRILGTRVLGKIEEGEPILWSDIEDPSIGQRFSRSIPSGHRAITLHADPRSSFAGLIRPGDRVDILQEPLAGTGFHPLLSDVPILAVDRSVREKPDANPVDEVSTLTLSLLPSNAARLANATRNGKILVLLRNPDDLFRPKTRPGARRKWFPVEIWKGGTPVGRITVQRGKS